MEIQSEEKVAVRKHLWRLIAWGVFIFIITAILVAGIGTCSGFVIFQGYIAAASGGVAVGAFTGIYLLTLAIVWAIRRYRARRK